MDKSCPAITPIRNHSLHGVAGELSNNVHETVEVPNTVKKSWYDVVLRLPTSRPSRIPQHEQPPHQSSTELRSHNVTNNGNDGRVTKISPTEDSKVFDQVSMEQSRDLDLFHQDNNTGQSPNHELANDVHPGNYTLQKHIEELCNELKKEKNDKLLMIRQMADLKVQFDELEELLRCERSLTDTSVDADQQLVNLSRELVETQQALKNSHRLIARLQKEQDAIGSLYEKKFYEIQMSIKNEQVELRMEQEQLQKAREDIHAQNERIKQRESRIGEWQSQLFQKDELIAQLNNRVSDLESNLLIANERLETMTTSARSQELYRSEEAEDLRILNDAQEQEILRLNKQTEVANHEAAKNEIRIQEMQAQIEELQKNEAVRAECTDQIINDFENASKSIIIEGDRTRTKLVALKDKVCVTIHEIEQYMNVSELNKKQQTEAESKTQHEATIIDDLKTQLNDCNDTIKDLKESIQQNDEKYESHVSGLMFTMNGLSNEREELSEQIQNLKSKYHDLKIERDQLQKQLSTLSTQTSSSQVQQLREALDELEKKHYKLEKRLLEAKLNLAASEEHSLQLQEEYDRRLSESAQDEGKNKKMYERAQRLRVKHMFDHSTDTMKESNGGSSDDIKTSELHSQITDLMQKQQNRSSNYQQSGGSMEEDMRKDLENSTKMVQNLSKQIRLLSEEKQNENIMFQEKLKSRDALISSMTESAATIEAQLTTFKKDNDILRARLKSILGLKGLKLSIGETLTKDEEVKLEASLASSKIFHDNLKKELHRLRDLMQDLRGTNSSAKTNSVDTPEFDDNDNDDATCATTSIAPHLQIKERDTAISKLVKQSMAQEKLITELRLQCKQAAQNVENLKLELENGSSLNEMSQLRQEAEVFASQVIEQDEEIQELKRKLREKEQNIRTLEKQLSDAKNAAAVSTQTPSLIRNLEAEIDELKEANQEQLSELRSLRRRERDIENSLEELRKAKNEINDKSKEVERLQTKVCDLSSEHEALRSQIKDKDKKITELEQVFKEELKDAELKHFESTQKLRDDLTQSQKELFDLKKSYVDEFTLDSMQTEIRNLRESLEKKLQEVEAAQETIRELDGMLADKREQQSLAHEEEKEELMVEIESLNRQLDEAKERMKEFERERSLIFEFKSKLDEAEIAREQSEKTIVENYERKLSLLALDKDLTLDNLRKQLFEEKEANACEIEDMSLQMKSYQVEVSDLREQLDAAVKERDSRVYALERTLEAQEQLVASMKTEMDHLQSSMEALAERRRKEIEDMQQELLSLSSSNTKMERELKSLHLELDAKEYTHKEQVSKLSKVIASYENSSPAEHRTAADLQMELRVKEVKDRLDKLKWRNTSLKEENENLRERLEHAEYQLRENQRQLAQTEELRCLLSEQMEKVELLEKELELSKTETEETNETKTTDSDIVYSVSNVDAVGPETNLPPRPPPASPSRSRGRSKSTEKTPSISSSSHSTTSVNLDKKITGPSTVRLSFLRRRASSHDSQP